jgi:hypothetical protein
LAENVFIKVILRSVDFRETANSIGNQASVSNPESETMTLTASPSASGSTA